MPMSSISMDREKISGLFDEILYGDHSTAIEEIACLTEEERRTLLTALEYAETEAEACCSRGAAIREVLNRFPDAGCAIAAPG